MHIYIYTCMDIFLYSLNVFVFLIILFKIYDCVSNFLLILESDGLSELSFESKMERNEKRNKIRAFK